MRALILSSSPAPSTMVVSSLVDHHFAGMAQLRDLGVLELETHLFADDFAAGEDGDVFQHALAAVAEARGLDGDAGEGAAQLVDHQSGQGFALDVLSDDEQRFARLDDLLQHRQKVLDDPRSSCWR